MPAEVVVVSKTTCWTDSLVALRWIKKVDKNWKLWVGQREKLEKLLTVIFGGIFLES